MEGRREQGVRRKNGAALTVGRGPILRLGRRVPKLPYQADILTPYFLLLTSDGVLHAS